jgi:hypothetical protein
VLELPNGMQAAAAQDPVIFDVVSARLEPLQGDRNQLAVVIRRTYKGPDSPIGSPLYLFMLSVARVVVNGSERAPTAFRVDGRPTDSLNVSANSAVEAEFDFEFPTTARGVDLVLPARNGKKFPLEWDTSSAALAPAMPSTP